MKTVKNQDELNDLLETVGARVNGVAMEAVQDLFHRLPWGMEIALSNGKKCVLKKFTEPRLNEETGRPEFGFDLKGDDWHLEFYVRQTGWEGVP